MSLSTRKTTEKREIRVFISSTFRDMQAERDELAKFVFPELRKLCQQRGVTWSSVDLRWGITEEDATRVGVLSICLDEIQHCRPYFIGILGERYGWIPEQVDPRALESEPWLAELNDRSITELEILHGVLNDPDMADHAIFYFRDPSYLDTLAYEQRKQFREQPNSDSARKLTDLKARIRSSGLPIVEDYPDPRTLGRLVQRNFIQLIDHLFPPGTEPDPLKREHLEQEAFAESRTHAYVARPEVIKLLNQHIESSDPPLTILGESGTGKTALLSNWALKYAETNLDDFIFMHLIGSTAASMDWNTLVRRCMHDLKTQYNIAEELVDDPDGLRVQFANWISIAASRAKLTLVIDALDQLEDRQGAPDLIWLPESLPDNVRVILSTLPGRSLEAIRKRGWPTYELKLLDFTERVQLIETYLSQYRKRLSTDHLEHIVNSPKTANPLFLKSLLNELRLFGEHEKLEERIRHYLDAPSIESLFEMILARFEQDYNRDRPDLVQDALSLIYASRRGLTESELQDLLGFNGSPLPQAYWSPFFLAAEPSLVNRSGLIDFFHNYFRSAVANRYLTSQSKIKDTHRCLARYFADRPSDMRKVEELPWQYQQVEDWDELFECIRDPEFLKPAWEQAEFDLRMYWAALLKNSRHTPREAYNFLLRSPRENFPLLKPVAELMYFLGATEDALAFHDARIEIVQENEPEHLAANALQWKARILGERGDYIQAMQVYERLEAACREQGEDLGLASVLNSKAVIRKKQGDLQGALDLHAEQEKIIRQHQDQYQLAIVLNNLGTILFEQGKFRDALKHFVDSEKIARGHDDKAMLAAIQNARAAIYDRLGDPKRALELLEQAETMQRALGDKHNLKITLGNRAAILRRQGKEDIALHVSGEVEHLGQELGDIVSIAASLNNQALVLKRRGDLNGALKLFKEMETMSREQGSLKTLQSALGNQASILHQQGLLDQALPLREEEIEICRRAGYRQDLAQALYTASELLFDLKRYEEALTLAQEGYNLAVELGDMELTKELERRWFPP